MLEVPKEIGSHRKLVLAFSSAYAMTVKGLPHQVQGVASSRDGLIKVERWPHQGMVSLR